MGVCTGGAAESMEKIESDLRESELKQRSLAKAYESVRAQATSIVIFSLQWKDLVDHFESTRDSMEARFRELEDREKDIGVRETELEAKEMNFQSELESKSNELLGLDKLREQKLKEVIDCKNHLNSLMSLIKEHNDEVIVQDKRLSEVEGFVRERETERDAIERRIKERTKKLNWVEKMVEEKSKLAESKEKEAKRFEEVLNKCVEDIELKDWQLNEIVASIEANKEELVLQEEQIKEAQRSIEECGKELKLKQQKIRFFQKLLVECSDTLESKEKRISEIEKKEKDFSLLEISIQELSSQLELKERELEVKEKQVESKVGELQKSKQDGEQHLDTMSKGLQTKERQLEDQAKELALKQKEFDSKERQLEDQARELELKGKEFVSIKKSTEEHNRILKAKERQLQVQAKEFEMKQKEFDLITKSNDEHTQNLELKERQLELRQKEFDSIKKSTEEQSQNLKSKERQLEGLAKELESKQKEFASIKKSTEEHTQILKVKERQLDVQAKELELMQKEIDSTKKCIEEHVQNLKLKERQLEDQAKELELKQKEFDSIKKSTEEHSRNLKAKENTSIFHSQVKIEQLEHIPSNNVVAPSSASNQSSINRDGRGLQLFMNEHLKRSDLVGSEISAVLEASSDPAKLVLDAMQGFYPSNSTVDNMECDFDLRVIRRSCILLLEVLKRVSPQINPQVREEAIKLAGDWKAKMTTTTENWLEVLGFLRLVITYEITSAYNEKELQSLIATVSECEQATELSRSLVSTDKASESIICSPVKTEKPESSLAKNAATVSSPNLQLTATTDASNLQGFLNELSRGNHLIQNETLAALQMSSDPAKFVLDVLQNSFAQYWGNGDVHFKETVMLSYINLLEQLMGVLQHVGPHLKDDATKLAIQWKANMGTDTENALEVLGFLQFIATYGLISTFTIKHEIVMFFGRISQDKQTRELCQTLGFADKITGLYIRNFIERNQMIEAVRLICTFKLMDTFRPVPLLEKVVENIKNRSRSRWKKKKSLDEKDKVIDLEIAVLRAVIRCIKDCNLESEYPSRNIEIQIVSLQKLKEDQRRSATSPACKVEQQQKKSPAPKVEQQEQTKALGSKVGQQEHKKALASNLEQQEQSKSLASNVGQQEQSKSLASNVEQHEQSKSLASKVEQQEQKKSLASKVEQHEQSKSLAFNVEQEEPNKFEQEERKKWNKRRRTQLHQQPEHQNKVQRTSGSTARPYPLPTFTPGYSRRSLSWDHENYRYPGQYGMADDEYGIGADCGHPRQFGKYASDYETGTIPNYGMHNSYPFMPIPPTYGRYQFPPSPPAYGRY